jgi:hypothetical protein
MGCDGAAVLRAQASGGLLPEAVASATEPAAPHPGGSE